MELSSNVRPDLRKAEHLSYIGWLPLISLSDSEAKEFTISDSSYNFFHR